MVKKILCLVALSCGSTLISQSAVVISNISMTTSSFSFTLSGSGSTASTPSSSDDAILIGTPGISGWRTGFFQQGNLTGDSVDGKTNLGYGVNSSADGDHILIRSQSGNLDFTDGGSVSVDFTDTLASYDPTKIDFNDLIVSWGYDLGNGLRPDPNFQIGSATVIPEPQSATWAIAIATATGLLLTRRKRRKHPLQA